ncbi:MAG: 2-diacylglycerol beta-glucosyltransferase [Verrucomicrobia bacterium]|nr:MAG: 2-diacylglycerol beta-glucosyltransferase [Verrucomicrobiota bacterium]
MHSVLILTAGYGEGHNAAARGLKEGFDLLGETNAEVLDLFAPAFGKYYQRSRGDYLKMANNTPALWAAIYTALDRFPFTSQLLSLLGPLKRELISALKTHRPSAVISVYPVYGHLIAAAAREAGLPGLKSYVLITDSITVNSVWYKCGADAFLVPNDDTAAVLSAARVPAENLFVSGFPVSTKYAAQGEARPDPGGSVPPRVLYMINGLPARAVALVERILRESSVELTVTAGKDEALKKTLEEMAARMQRRLTVLGWVNNMPQLLRRNHLLIGKAGGAAVQEALAAKTPMLITQILPGQEEGNARLLLQNGCGAHCPTNEAIVKSLAHLFERNADGWNQMHRHTCALSRPDAAITTARWLAQRIKNTASTPKRNFGLRANKD